MLRHPITSIVSRALLCGALSLTLACDADEPPEDELRSATSGPSMRLVFDGPSSGTRLVRVVGGEDPPSTVEVRFEPLTATERLVGQPSAWCNSPGPGEALIFDVPVPANPGDPDTVEDLVVNATSEGAIVVRVPITLKHGV